MSKYIDVKSEDLKNLLYEKWKENIFILALADKYSWYYFDIIGRVDLEDALDSMCIRDAKICYKIGKKLNVWHGNLTSSFMDILNPGVDYLWKELGVCDFQWLDISTLLTFYKEYKDKKIAIYKLPEEKDYDLDIRVT